MEVLLKESIPTLGEIGEVVKVRPGYARNYLLPRGLAVEANPKNVREMEHHQRQLAAKRDKQKQQAEVLAQTLGALTLTFVRESGEEGKLFGSVTTKDVVEALRREKVAVDRRQIQLDAPIKTLGEHAVTVKLHPEVAVTVKVRLEKG